MRNKFLLFTFAALTAFETGCIGITNKNGAAEYFEIASSATSTLASCHYDRFVSKIAGRLQTNCAICHESGRQFTIIVGTDSAINTLNFNSIAQFIESDALTAENTTLMEKVSSSSTSNHPYKLPSTDTDFYDFVNGALKYPSCQVSEGSCPDIFWCD